MAINFQITAGSGTTMAADEFSWQSTTPKFQVVKVMLGSEGAGQRLLQAGETTKANSVPVCLPTDDGWGKTKYVAQTTTVQTVKASAGTLGGIVVYNPNATVAYVQIFDVSGTVTLGTTSPDIIIPVAPTSVAPLSEFARGVNMANAIKLACTTTATGSTAPGTGLDMTVFWK